MVNFFIHRPIFSAVISIIITIVGGLCIAVFARLQFPAASRPHRAGVASYSGASGPGGGGTVAAPIESR
jgi:HAE1 family hydrophobic/amphiphilic exporter-1/multidrug efflux pump